MKLMDQELSTLIARGQKTGSLTYEEVNAYLPDEDVNPEKLDMLLLAVERNGIELIEAPKKGSSPANAPEPNVPGMRKTAGKSIAGEASEDDDRTIGDAG